jgi:TonB family protein
VLATNLSVRVGQKVTIQNLKSGRSAECHVTVVEHGLNGMHHVELEFTGSQPEFWPVQFPAEETRIPATSRAQETASLDSKPVHQKGPASDNDLLVLADSVAQDFNVSRVHSPERIATKVASADSVAQFRAANRAAHRREQRKKAIYSALFFAVLSAGAVGVRYWFTHKPQNLEAAAPPELRSVAQKIARAIPSKSANATQASAVDSAPTAEPSASADVQSSVPPVDTGAGAPATVSHSSAVANQTLGEATAQAASLKQAETQVAVRHGSSFAAASKLKSGDSADAPEALPLQVAQTASLTKPEALKDVVAQMPAPTAVLAAQVPKRAIPARLIHSVPAQYPQMARQLHVEGEVMLEVQVDVSGTVSTVKAISGPPLLRTAAIDCVKRWKYQPATLGDKPVASTEAVRVDFHWR